ncbi:MAG: C39 family peptidase [Caldilineaceae bacterium]|nr:C39 family peptidase [Caldilineaceae bacterium]
MTLLNVSHWRQRQPADCLAACGAMILHYLQVPFRYESLVELLEVKYYGAPFSHIHKLATMGLFVTSKEWGGIPQLEQYLETGLPIIANVNTKELPYWDREANHVIVIIGIEGDTIFLNDPAFDEAPQRVPLAEFLLAWDEQYQQYGVIGLDQIE